MRIIKVSICVIIFLSASMSFRSEAASGHDLWRYYVLPATVHAPGLAGTYWRTDVTVVNPYNWRSITVYMRFLRADEDNTNAQEHSFNIAAKSSLLMEDAVYSVFGINGNGAIEVYTKDGAYFVTSAKVYTGDSSTFGLTEPGQEYFGHEGDTTIVSGMMENSRYRGSIGVVNVSSRSVVVEASVYDNRGNLRGRKEFNLKRRSQTQVALSKFCNPFNSGYVIFKCLTSSSSSLSWIGYGTVTDNTSGDGIFMDDRRNDQGVQYQPQYDLSGWWKGSMSGYQGSDEGFLLIYQVGAELWIYVYDVDGRVKSEFYGFQHGDQILLEDFWVFDAPCFDTDFYGAELTTTGESITGTITLAAENYSECVDGTITMYVSPTSFPPTKALKRSFPENMPERERHPLR